MNKPRKILEGIYTVAGPDVTGGGDAAAYLVVSGPHAALIDSGCDENARLLISNIDTLLNECRSSLKTLILTHNHIDHVGGAAELKKRYSLKIAMHEADALALEDGDNSATAADWYGVDVRPAGVDVKFGGNRFDIQLGDDNLSCLHTPGHTPGSIAVLLERAGKRILFGQDIHGPFSPQFRSDIALWRKSMKMLLDLKCDILCEGHFGVFDTAFMVESFIQKHLKAHS